MAPIPVTGSTSARPAAAVAFPPHAPVEPSSIQVSVTVGPAAEDLLASDDLARAWDELHAACPWATVFQSRTFARIWFAHYGDRYVPAVVTAVAPSGRLAGLFVLAAEPGGRRLHVAGAGQCEHQSWIALPECGDAFAAAAFDEIAKRFPGARMRLLRLPAGTPIAWTSAPSRSGRVLVEEQPWFFRDLADGGEASDKKWNRRSLKKLGEVGEPAFEEVVGDDALRAFFDEFVLHHDFRHAGAYGQAEFAEDPRKRPFHEDLFRAGFLRAFVLRAGDRLAAGALAFPDGRLVRQGPHTYAADLSRFHASKHLMHAQFGVFAAEGFAAYDLSPGPGYKERYATRRETSLSLQIDFSAWGAFCARASRRRDDLARAVAVRMGRSPDDVRRLLAKLRTKGLTGVVRAVASRAVSRFRRPRTKWVQVYSMTRDAARSEGRRGRFRENSVEDLMRFTSDETGRTRSAFLASALERMAEGHVVLTHVVDGRLAAHGWIAEGGSQSRVSEVGASIHVPDGAYVLYDYHTHPDFRRRGLYEEALRQALAHVAEKKDCRDVWIGVADDNPASAKAIVKIGWQPIFHVRNRGPRPADPRDARSLHPKQGLAPRAVQAAKRGAYHAAKAVGLFALCRRLTRRSLRVLCYHGFDIAGEHEFAPRLFMRGETFERRLGMVLRDGWKVLPLGEAVERFRRGEHPDDAVVLTIDDGAASVLLRAVGPVVERRVPATLYVTTYHVMRPRPVFQTALAYLLWKTDRAEMDLTKIGPFQRGTLDLGDPSQVAAFGSTLVAYAKTHLDEPGRQELGRRVAARLGLDWKEMEESRRCSLLTLAELRDLAARGIDLQLHTHRHRLPLVREETLREIEDNRVWMRKVAPGPYEHFCYPSGEYAPAHFPWLREAGILSATTCDAGLNPPGTEPLALRRILDGECVSDIEFEAEMSGFADLVRRALRR